MILYIGKELDLDIFHRDRFLFSQDEHYIILEGAGELQLYINRNKIFNHAIVRGYRFG